MRVIIYLQTINELENLLQEKLDLGTHSVLSQASALANPETGNLEYSADNSSVSMCLWGNLSKNPRLVTSSHVNDSSI